MKTQNKYQVFERIEGEGERTLTERLDALCQDTPFEGTEAITLSALHIIGTNFYLVARTEKEGELCG